MKKTKKLVICSLFIAIGVILSKVFIPIGGAKCFPVQHLINVLSAVFFGPIYAVINAFIISLIRNMLGFGTLLAFPGSMIGALLAGLCYSKFKNIYSALIGELFGTGIIGGLLSFPIAILIMGKEVGAFFFIVPFLVSSLSGVIISFMILKIVPLKYLNMLINS